MSLSDQDYRITEYLGQYISDHKKNFVEKVLSKRTRYLTIVLEDIYQSQNASAVVRTCECMGLQDIHIIENSTRYEVNRYVLKGSYKWVNIIRHKKPSSNNTELCFQRLRELGYTIYATDPSAANQSIHEIDLCQSKAAIVFGNELNGLSDYALDNADHRVRIPMYGFTESLNISASVAVSLSTLIPRLRSMPGIYELRSAEKDELRLSWYRKMVKKSTIIEKQFLKTIA
jgi:tRNA (guanosine-2'-O-)-methyltransferase